MLDTFRLEDDDDYEYEFSVLRTVHKVWRPTFFEVHVLRAGLFESWLT